MGERPLSNIKSSSTLGISNPWRMSTVKFVILAKCRNSPILGPSLILRSHKQISEAAGDNHKATWTNVSNFCWWSQPLTLVKLLKNPFSLTAYYWKVKNCKIPFKDTSKVKLLKKEDFFVIRWITLQIRVDATLWILCVLCNKSVITMIIEFMSGKRKKKPNKWLK